MKKYFYALLALLVVVVSCKKPEPEPIIPDDPTENNAYDVLYEVDVDYYFDLGYGGTELNYADFVKDGKHIWEQFGLNSQADFIKALGTADVSNGGAQSGQSINFCAIDGSTGYLNETVSTTNGWGHWFTAQGDVCNWGADAYFFTEGYFVSNENLAITLGNYPGHINAGEKYTIIEAFADDETTVAVQFNINVTDELPAVTLTKVGEAKTTMEVSFDSDYMTHEITGVDYAAIASAIGCEVGAATFYGIDAAGNANALFKGTDIWYNADGPASWGAGCTIHFGYDAENGIFTTCLYPDEELIGKTHSLTVAVANGEKAFYQTVEVSVKGQDTWQANATIRVQGDAVDTDFDFANLVNYFGYADVNALIAAVLAEELTMTPLNADGSKGPYSQAYDINAEKGYFVVGSFYNVSGDVVNWASGEDAVYFDFYGGTEGEGYIGLDVTPFDNLTEDYVDKTLSFTIQFSNGEKTAYVVFNVNVESAVPFAEYTLEGYTFTVKITANPSYKNIVIPMPIELSGVLGVEGEWTLDNFNVIGLNADESEYKNAEGEYGNTAGGVRGWWYATDGNVCNWSQDAGPFAFAESDDLANYRIGVHPTVEAGTNGTIKFKYVAGDKSQVITVNVNVVESL